MKALDDLRMYGRFARGLRGYLGHPVSLDEARSIVRRRLAERERQFLRTVERGIFGYPRSPYRPLLQMAGCTLGDLQAMVRARGIEGTLLALRESGVYVTFEEFKGRQPIVRSGRVIPIEPRDFDNPYLAHAYRAESGGTTGGGTRVDIDLEHLAAQAPLIALAYHAHGVLGVPTAVWRSVLPDGSGVANLLRHARIGQLTARWFTPLVTGDLRPALKYRLATRSIVALGRLHGAALPWPEPVRLEDAVVVARWMAGALERSGACLVRAHVSAALRVCLAAGDAGLDLTGAVFLGGGEPPTPGKVAGIERAGARHVTHYVFTEAGAVGAGCGRPADGNDLHLLEDTVALVQWPRQVPGTDVSVAAFGYTSLTGTAPKMLLNVESDDHGVVEERACGCPLEPFFPRHLRHVASFRKLTGEGVTLVGSEMMRILDEVLPARFGGSALDYQLQEEEDERHLTRLIIVVSPRVALADEQALIDTVLEALGRGSAAGDLARALWTQARTLRVKRAEPALTARGKLLPLRGSRSGASNTERRG